MRPACRAERAAAHCVPPEQRTVAGPGADASGGGLTNQAKQGNKTQGTSLDNLFSKTSVSVIFSLMNYYCSGFTQQLSVPPEHAGSCPYCLPGLAGWS